ncbi:hypothetical protein G7Y89_g3379 [Cudoniella acicularis]|uniref:Uncharacterized protein n=1 Tax=Cudoniella acicularis TaxID=354080 RepID=A0A8H4W8F8_9HELO|nr:hypothetical protein G7Y89_g3379 [Cudoniella acicularis]
MQCTLVEYPLLALREALQTLDEIIPVSGLEREKGNRQVFEIAADYLDWSPNHKFELSWPGNIPREILDTIHVNCESPYFGRPLQLAHDLLVGALPNIAMIRFLVRLGADLNLVYVDYISNVRNAILLVVVKNGQESAVRVLLELGLSPNSPDQKTHPALRAKVHGRRHMLKTLLEFGGDIDVSESIHADEFKTWKYPIQKKKQVGE